MSQHPRRRAACAALALVTIFTGLVWRMAPLQLPFFLWKYGGSALWAIAVYWFVGFLLPSGRPAALAAAACLFALAVELSRRIPSPALEAFRHTLAGKLMLGSIFSLRNIVAYWTAILATAVVDHIRKAGEKAASFQPPR